MPFLSPRLRQAGLRPDLGKGSGLRKLSGCAEMRSSSPGGRPGNESGNVKAAAGGRGRGHAERMQGTHSPEAHLCAEHARATALSWHPSTPSVPPTAEDVRMPAADKGTARRGRLITAVSGAGFVGSCPPPRPATAKPPHKDVPRGGQGTVRG